MIANPEISFCFPLKLPYFNCSLSITATSSAIIIQQWCYMSTFLLHFITGGPDKPESIIIKIEWLPYPSPSSSPAFSLLTTHSCTIIIRWAQNFYTSRHATVIIKVYYYAAWSHRWVATPSSIEAQNILLLTNGCPRIYQFRNKITFHPKHLHPSIIIRCGAILIIIWKVKSVKIVTPLNLTVSFSSSYSTNIFALSLEPQDYDYIQN